MPGTIANWFIRLTVAGADNVKQAMGGVRNTMEGASGAAYMLRGALGAVAGALSVHYIAQLSRTAARNAEIRDSFMLMAERAGESGEEILAAMEEAAGGTVAQADLILGANRAMALGLSTSAEDIADLMEVASARARVMGLETTQAFNNIVTGIGRMSPLILDNLGFVVDLERAYENYAESLGVSVDALSEAQKRQALQNDVIREGSDLVEAMDDVIGETADAWRTFDSNVREAKAGLGELLNAMLGIPYIVSAIAEWTQGTGNFVDRLTDAQQKTADYTQEMDRWVQAGAATVRESMELEDHIRTLNANYTLGRLTMEEYDREMENLINSFGVLSPAQRRAAEGYRDFRGEVWDTAQIVRSAAEEQAIANQELLRSGKMWEQIGLDASDWEERIGWLENYYDRLEEEQDRAQQGAEDAAEAYRQAWQQAFSAMEGDIRGLLGPSQDWEDMLNLPRLEEWDEDARRMMDIVMRGSESPWVEFFQVPEDVLSGSEQDIKTWASKMVKAFYEGRPVAEEAGMDPERYLDNVVEQYKSLLARRQFTERIKDEVVSRLQAQGIEFDPLVFAEATMGMDVTGPAGQWTDALVAAVEQEDPFGEVWRSAEAAQEEHRALIEATGAAGGRIYYEGLVDELDEKDPIEIDTEIDIPEAEDIDLPTELEIEVEADVLWPDEAEELDSTSIPDIIWPDSREEAPDLYSQSTPEINWDLPPFPQTLTKPDILWPDEPEPIPSESEPEVSWTDIPPIPQVEATLIGAWERITAPPAMVVSLIGIWASLPMAPEITAMVEAVWKDEDSTAFDLFPDLIKVPVEGTVQAVLGVTDFLGADVLEVPVELISAATGAALAGLGITLTGVKAYIDQLALDDDVDLPEIKPLTGTIEELNTSIQALPVIGDLIGTIEELNISAAAYALLPLVPGLLGVISALTLADTLDLPTIDNLVGVITEAIAAMDVILPTLPGGTIIASTILLAREVTLPIIENVVGYLGEVLVGERVELPLVRSLQGILDGFSVGLDADLPTVEELPGMLEEFVIGEDAEIPIVPEVIGLLEDFQIGPEVILPAIPGGILIASAVRLAEDVVMPTIETLYANVKGTVTEIDWAEEVEGFEGQVLDLYARGVIEEVDAQAYLEREGLTSVEAQAMIRAVDVAENLEGVEGDILEMYAKGVISEVDATEFLLEQGLPPVAVEALVDAVNTESFIERYGNPVIDAILRIVGFGDRGEEEPEEITPPDFRVEPETPGISTEFPSTEGAAEAFIEGMALDVPRQGFWPKLMSAIRSDFENHTEAAQELGSLLGIDFLVGINNAVAEGAMGIIDAIAKAIFPKIWEELSGREDRSGGGGGFR